MKKTMDTNSNIQTVDDFAPVDHSNDLSLHGYDNLPGSLPCCKDCPSFMSPEDIYFKIMSELENLRILIVELSDKKDEK